MPMTPRERLAEAARLADANIDVSYVDSDLTRQLTYIANALDSIAHSLIVLAGPALFQAQPKPEEPDDAARP